MAKPIQITIPEPCSQPWEEMTPCGQGRFCGHCQKTVIDFSTWSDTALYDFFAKRTEKVCGRFLPSQLNRKINIPPQPHSRLYRLTVALGLTLVFVQGTGVYAQNKPPLAVQTVTRSNQNSYGCIRGKVLDERKEPMIGVKMTVLQDGIIKDGVVTDFDGNYFMQPLDTGYYDVHVFSEGHTRIIITRIIVQNANSTVQNFTLNTTDTLTVVKSYKKPLVQKPNSEVMQAEDIRFLPTGGAMGDIVPALYQSQRGRGIPTPQPVIAPPIKQQKKANTIKLNKDHPTKTTITGDDIKKMPNQ